MLKFKQENETATPDGIDIFNIVMPSGRVETLFTHKKAMELFGDRIPTVSQWETIRENASEILGFPIMTGIIEKKFENVKRIGESTAFWSSKNDDEMIKNEVENIIVEFVVGPRFIRHRDRKQVYYALPVRLLDK